MTISILKAALASALLCLGAPAAMAQDAVVGILEDQPGEAPVPHVAYVRAVFHTVDGRWAAYDSTCLQRRCFPEQTIWTVGFDGRSVGQVNATTPEGWDLISQVGRQTLDPGARAPFVGERAMAFTGWSGGPVFRPLVTASTGQVADPERWARSALPAASTTALRAHIRQKFPRAARCANAEENTPAPWTYADADLTVDGAYASRTGWRVARIGLTADDYRCDGPLPTGGESPFSPLTVAIAPDGRIIDLGWDMTLLDAGDYDANGKSEVVFMYSGYNADGYTLFTDDFGHKATFRFSYH